MNPTSGITRRKLLKWAGVTVGSTAIGVSIAGSSLPFSNGLISHPRFQNAIGDLFPIDDIDVPDELVADASRHILRAHSRQSTLNGERVKYVIPSARYPNYWYWDSMLAAIAAAFVDPALAREIIDAQALIFRELGAHGPQIVYFNRSPFPLEYRLFLKTRTLDGVDQLTQTPLSGLALEIYATKTGDLEAVERILPAYSAHYAWLMKHRIIDDSIPLPVTIHPFESLDAQPATDVMYRKHLGRNTRFQGLAARTLAHSKRLSFDAKRISANGGFVKYDVCFLSFYIRSLYSLARLWAACGNQEESVYWYRQATHATEIFIETCFDPETGFFYGRRANGQKERLTVKTASGLFPLLLNLPPAVGDAVVRNLTDSRQFLADDLYIPFVARNETAYFQESVVPLWRGPGNSVIDFTIILGLHTNGRTDLAARLHDAQYRRFLHRLQAGHAFPEFYTPETAFRAPYTWGTLAACNPQELLRSDSQAPQAS